MNYNSGVQYTNSFGGGLCFVDSDRIALQVGVAYYHKCCESGREPGRILSWTLPAFGLNISVGRSMSKKQYTLK